MLCSCIRRDDELRNAWLPVRFPEELQGVSSLRDLLIASLLRLAEDHGIATAVQWYDRAESEMDDEQSLELAVSGLREIAAQTDKRMILFVENLDHVFGRKLDTRAQATLRRLLMVDPFLMMIGTAVRMFEAVQDYPEPFFNYFARVPLDRLNDEQVYQVLAQRARFDGSDEFSRQYSEHKPKIRAVTRLTGGNLRLSLLLYELLSQGGLGSTVTALRQVVDELTPLLKDVLESQFTEQQAKIVDVLMRAGGTATPTDIAKSSRMSLNTVTTQLQRMKDMQVVEVRGGGKGRPAHYSVPDPLFRIWYQLRYLRSNKRRVEVFAEVLRLWLEEEARLEMLHGLAGQVVDGAAKTARDRTDTAEYFAASLAGVRYAPGTEERLVSIPADIEGMREAAGAAVEKNPDNPRHRLNYGVALGMSGDHQGAFECFDGVAGARHVPVRVRALAFYNRAVSKGMLGDVDGAGEDYTRVAEMPGTPSNLTVLALNNRAAAKGNAGDYGAAHASFMASLRVESATAESRVAAGKGAVLAALRLEDAVKLSEASALVLGSASELGREERLSVFAGVLSFIAAPNYRVDWAFAWRALRSASTDDDTIQGIEPLRPVAEILETGDRSKLDSLPPHEREFAEELLRKFDEVLP